MMTNGPSTPSSAAAPTTSSSLLLQPSPAPRLGSRRPSNSKVGSRAPSDALANSGEGSPATPPMTLAATTPKEAAQKQPSSQAVTPTAVETPIAEVSSSPAEGQATPPADASTKPIAALKIGQLSLKNESKSATPRGRSRSASQMSVASKKSTKSDKQLKSLSPKFSGNVSLSATPLIYRARFGTQGDDSPAAGVKYTTRYAVPRSTLRTVEGKTQPSTDVFSLSPLPEGYLSPRTRNKRVMFAAYQPTAVAYSNEESRKFQAEQRLGGKSCASSPRSMLAPWEREHPAPGSPKRAGSARPPVRTAACPPWAKEDDGYSHNRSTRSHSAGAVLRSTASPYGVTEGSHATAFAKGEDKIIESSRPACARPTTGRCSKAVPADHDILNPNAPMDKASPVGRRAPPAWAIAPSEEYVRPLCRKSVEQVEHSDRPVGKQCNPMATAACEASPFRTGLDDARASVLSPERSMMGSQPRPAPKNFSKVFISGRSGGVQSYHIDPTNALGSTSEFSPPRERPPTAKKGMANKESEPGSDLHSKLTVCPVRAGRNKETLVGVMYAAPQRPLPPYEVVAPFWTADSSSSQ